MADGGPFSVAEAYSTFAGIPVFSSTKSRTVLPCPSEISSAPSPIQFTVRPGKRSLSSIGKNSRRSLSCTAFNCAGGGVEGQTVAADHGIADAGEERVGGLGRLGDFAALAAADALADGGRHAPANLVAVENGAGSGEGGGIGSGGAGTDFVEIVADDIG